ncbi:MAG: ABC transporter permease [Bacteroidota bacterium]
MSAGITEQLVNFIAVSLRCATPILFAALGVLFMARAGIVNMGAEGMMLVGAFAAVTGSFYTGSAWLGLLIAATAAAAIGAVFAYVTVSLRGNQMVTGAAINILAAGLTSTFNRVIFGINTTPPKIAVFQPFAVPLFSKLPVAGPLLFNLSPLVYLCLLAVPVAHFLLYRTDWGLAVRATGEHPRAVESVGIDIFRVRYATTIGGAALAGVGGGFLSLGMLSFFAENMVAGRGYIALAAVIFGKYTPGGTLGAALLFGAGNSLQFLLQASGSKIPQDFFLMVPYVLTLAALCGFVGRATAPAQLGRPYAKE